jgi:hypothetical protein
MLATSLIAWSAIRVSKYQIGLMILELWTFVARTTSDFIRLMGILIEK